MISSVEPRLRGGFMSINSAIQQLGLGAASLLAGSVIGHSATGTLSRYWLVGFIAVGATLLAIALAWRVKPVAKKKVRGPRFEVREKC
jgi:predicted MFS family arabinose efflux permease